MYDNLGIVPTATPHDSKLKYTGQDLVAMGFGGFIAGGGLQAGLGLLERAVPAPPQPPRRAPR